MAAVTSSEQIISETKIAKLAEKNPDLTYEFIKTLLIAQQEAKIGKLEAYSFDEN